MIRPSRVFSPSIARIPEVCQCPMSAHAPILPLPMCDAPHCGCHYKHHKDRRAGPRRRSEVGMMVASYNGNERRRTRGRRAEDRD